MFAVAIRQAIPSGRRAFSSSSAARKDLIQDLYLSQLRAYKPAPKAANAHAGLVKSFSAPSAPQAPQLPSDLAAELSAFDAAEPSFAAPAAKKETTGASEGQGEGVKEYLEFLEKDLPKADAHH